MAVNYDMYTFGAVSRLLNDSPLVQWLQTLPGDKQVGWLALCLLITQMAVMLVQWLRQLEQQPSGWSPLAGVMWRMLYSFVLFGQMLVGSMITTSTEYFTGAGIVGLVLALLVSVLVQALVSYQRPDLTPLQKEGSARQY